MKAGTLGGEPDHKQLFMVQRLKFKGPDPPTTVTRPLSQEGQVPAEGGEPVVDEQTLAIREEDNLITEFTEGLRGTIE